ncbi:hypothetical protein [Streptomyces aureus]|uniref:hypothetical protein n=1 Tax=Streptomyces aureus TaxID=193461 RepID=UPI0033D7B8A6
MSRRVARAAALLVSALVALPGTAAAAVDKGDGPLIVINNVNQRADGDIFDVGHDNIVGSGNGNGAQTPGIGAPGATTAAARIISGSRLPIDVLRLASQEGSGEDPTVIYPN